MFIANRKQISTPSPEQKSLYEKEIEHSDNDQRLQRIVTQLKRNNQTKDLLLTKIGHELLTPLNGIIGALELTKNAEPDKVGNLVDTAINSATALNHVIRDFVDLSQLTRGELRLKKENFSLKEALQDLIDEVAVDTARKGLTWKQDFDIDLDMTLRGDGERLTQVIRSLTSNAIKFTSSGTITLSLNGQIENGRVMLFRAVVEDTGIGIGKADQVHIFNSFYQVEDFCNRHHQGSGVGLSLAYLLVRQMRGEVLVQSTPGKGSRFEIFIPIPLAQPVRTSNDNTDNVNNPNVTTIPERGHQPTSRGKQPTPATENRPLSLTGHLLIVEDNNVNQMVLKGLLERVGMTCTIAGNGKIALEKIEQEEFDIILMDCQMPVMDGLTATKAIRQLNSYKKSTPIIAITANVTEKDRQSCIDAGMDDFLPKPIRPDTLYPSLQKWLELDGEKEEKSSKYAN